MMCRIIHELVFQKASVGSQPYGVSEGTEAYHILDHDIVFWVRNKRDEKKECKSNEYEYKRFTECDQRTRLNKQIKIVHSLVGRSQLSYYIRRPFAGHLRLRQARLHLSSEEGSAPRHTACWFRIPIIP